jgi:hypothetical protein
MPSAQAKLAKEVLSVLLELFPLGSVAKSAIKLPFGYLLDRSESKTKAKSIEGIACAIAAKLSVMPDHTNPGAARSAAYDVVHILKLGKVCPELLIELNLDPTLLLSHLMISGEEVLRTASQQRKSFIELGLSKIADAVVECSPELPGVQLAFMQAMLRS